MNPILLAFNRVRDLVVRNPGYDLHLTLQFLGDTPVVFDTLLFELFGGFFAFEFPDSDAMVIEDFLRALGIFSRDAVAVMHVAFIIGPLVDLLFVPGHGRGPQSKERDGDDEFTHGQNMPVIM